MSPSNINSFVGDLVQMAQAMEQLPKVEAERDELKINLDRALDTVQSRELRIIDLNATIAELNNKVRSLEVERDDASFRVLEAEDREHAALNYMQTAKEHFLAAMLTIDPPKPEPVKEPEASPPTASEPQAVFSQTSASSSTGAVTETEPTHGPYFGKRYDAQPAYINFNDWLAGGGTEADYYWRPDRESGSTF